MEAAREQVGGELTPLEERLEHDEYESRIEQLKKEIEAEIRRRLVADRGVEAMAKTLRKPLPEDVDFMHASRDEMATLRKALYPLTRKLAVRLARKRRHGRKGPLDFRNTVRHSLSATAACRPSRSSSYPRPVQARDHGRSPTSPARSPRSPASRCMLVYAISGQFSKVRSFVFIDGIDEVTELLRGRRGHHRGRPPGQHRGRRRVGRRPLRLRPRLRGVLGAAGARRSARRRRCCCSATPATTTTPSQAWVVKEMRHKARHVYWLNPEPRSRTGTPATRSSASTARTCDGVFECRNLRQLERFVENLA